LPFIAFFGFQNIPIAFAVIVALWLFIVVLMGRFFKINKWAAYLLIPYFAWVSFASVLNLMLWILN